MEAHNTPVLPPLSTTCFAPIPTCKQISYRYRQLWAAALSEAMSAAVRDNTTNAWALLAMLPKCVLPAPYRGGRKGHTSHANHVLKCLERWKAGEYAALWSDALPAASKKQLTASPNSHADDERAAIRAELLARQGEFSRGMAALTASPMAPDNPETLSKLQKKHPCCLPRSEYLSMYPGT